MCQRRQKSVMLSALKGESKFCGNRKPSSQREPDGHVRVAGEVEVDLERVAQAAEPRQPELPAGVA